MSIAKQPSAVRIAQQATGEDTVQTYREYEARQTKRNYSLAHIGRVQTLLERDQRRSLASCPKVENVWNGPLFLGEPPAARPYVVVMFVRDLAGKVTFENPGDIGGGETDWWLYREGMRAEMDAVGGGAASLRGSGITWSLYDPELVRFRTETLEKPRHPWQVIFTGSGNLDSDREYILAVPEFPVVVLTSSQGADRLASPLRDRPQKHVVSIGKEPRTLNLAEGLRILREQFLIRRMLVVGGAELSTSLLHAGLVDELFLTDAPRLLGGEARKTIFEGTGFPPESAPTARLMTVKVGVRDASTLFFRYRLS